MSTPILCNNEEITLQKKGLIHWQDELILKQKQKNWYYRSLKPTILTGGCRICQRRSKLVFKSLRRQRRMNWQLMTAC